MTLFPSNNDVYNATLNVTQTLYVLIFQVVWKATTAVGVAQASRGSGFSKEIFIVARYSPTGNVLRRFQKNVGVKQSKS